MGRIGYDDELRRHDAVLRRAWGVARYDHVLDVGCGLGQTTCSAARMAAEGHALGVDISAPAVARARELAVKQGVDNVAFECADVQRAGFPAERFDLTISRFGTMFFDDPVAAFAGIGRALRPGGRLVMMVWQAWEANEWEVALRHCLPESGEPAGASAFSLGDPVVVRRLLGATGFADVGFTDVREPVYYGPSVAAAVNWVGGFLSVKEGLRSLDPAGRAAAVARLREMLAAHCGADGVWLGSSAWIVTARSQKLLGVLAPRWSGYKYTR